MGSPKLLFLQCALFCILACLVAASPMESGNSSPYTLSIASESDNEDDIDDPEGEECDSTFGPDSSSGYSGEPGNDDGHIPCNTQGNNQGNNNQGNNNNQGTGQALASPDSPRFIFTGCDPQQKAQLQEAVKLIQWWALAGLQATNCQKFDSADANTRNWIDLVDTFGYMFRRNGNEVALVSALLHKIYLRATPNKSTSNQPILPIFCAAPTDYRCNQKVLGTSAPRLAYTDRQDIGTDVPRDLQMFVDEKTSDGRYIESAVNLCPAVWTAIKPLPQRCAYGVSSAAMPTTLVSVLFQQMVHVASGLGIGDAAYAYNTFEQCRALNTDRTAGAVALKPTTNAASYMNLAYLSWRAGWGTRNDEPTQYRYAMQPTQCLVGVFGNPQGRRP